MIEVRDLQYRYPSSAADAVRGISFSVDPGEIFGFLGPSGAGKSTTQKILIGILQGYRGTVAIKGRELSRWKRDLYRHIGVGFELPNLYSRFSALENLKFFARLYDTPCRDRYELLELTGLEQDARTKTAEFSKGMKMRLNFCRALIHDPEILFLDEPTSGLDPTSGRRIMEIILDERRRGKTVFLTTHNMATADQLCDRVAFIVQGQIPLTDSPRSLKLKHGTGNVRVETRRDGSARGDTDIQRHDFPLQGLGSNNEFLSLLSENRIETIHSQEATLEDVFIAATGKELR